MINDHKLTPNRKCRVALVDDDEGVYLAVRSLLEAETGYFMAYFNAPEAFLGSAKPEDFDCILLDYQFNGGMNGMDLLKRLAGVRSSTPVIMMTSMKQALLPQLTGMRGLGLKEILAKPFEDAELLAALSRAMPSANAQASSSTGARDWQTHGLESPAPKESPSNPPCRDDKQLAALPSQSLIETHAKRKNSMNDNFTYHIALIDDEESVYFATRSLVEPEGGRVSYFNSPKMFRDSAKPEDFDCILLDCLFHGRMEGKELLKHLTKHHPSTPVVKMTEPKRVSLRDAFEMSSLGARAILVKPFTSAELWASLYEAMQPLTTQPPTTPNNEQASNTPEIPQPTGSSDSGGHRNRREPTSEREVSPPSDAPPTGPSRWETEDLEDLASRDLTKECLPYLHRRAERNLNPDESNKLKNLTFREMQVFLLAAQQYDEMKDNKLAEILGIKLSAFQEHIYNTARKLETNGKKGWRRLFDKLNKGRAKPAG